MNTVQHAKYDEALHEVQQEFKNVYKRIHRLTKRIEAMEPYVYEQAAITEGYSWS